MLIVGTVVATNFVSAGAAPGTGTVTVSFNYNGATGGDTVTSATVASGTQADEVLPIPVKSGSEFTGWFNTESLLMGQRITTINENDSGTLTAGFVPPELAQTLNLMLPPPPPTCAEGGSCALGEVGPGGGLVFLISGGRTYEMAPKTWKGGSADPGDDWCSDRTNSVTTGTAVGTGSANTTAMLTSVPPFVACTNSAANAVRAFNGGGKSDWFLASEDELAAMYSYKALMTGEMVAIYGFSALPYWSSSQANVSAARSLNFNTASWGNGAKSSTLRVRPVRSF